MCITEFKYTLLLKTNHHLSLRQAVVFSLLEDLASMMMPADRARW